MTAVLKQASNNTGLSLAREITPGVVDGTVSWLSQEPNSYKDFGAKYKTVARSPINSSRQNKKGVTTDLDATGGWQEDLTAPAFASKAEGLFYADFRKKGDAAVTAVNAGNDEYTTTNGAAYVAGDLLFASGFAVAANNGLKHVTASAAGEVTVLEALADEAVAPEGAMITRVGFVFAAGDLTYTAATKTLASTAKDFTTLGLIIGEWLFVGCDAGGVDQLGSNLGFARIASITAHAIVLDKIQPLVSTTGTAGVIADSSGNNAAYMFFGRVVKNELDTGIKHYTFQAERTLGKDDTAALNNQAEYITGSVIDEAVFTFNSADKATVDWTLMSRRSETRTSAQGPKPGKRPALTAASAFNTSTDVKRTAIQLVGSDAPLYAYLMDLSITIKNNNKANKAIGYLGAIDMTEGNFEVSAAVTAYFANVSAAQAIENNKNVTLDTILARENHGIIFDIPLVSLSDGLPKIAANEAIQLPLDIDAATAASINPNTDYTMMVMFFDYLPTAVAP